MLVLLRAARRGLGRGEIVILRPIFRMDLMEEEGQREGDHICELPLVLIIQGGYHTTFPGLRNDHEEFGETLESLQPKGNELFGIWLGESNAEHVHDVPHEGLLLISGQVFLWISH